MSDDQGRFSVVMVCTGNICRSPAAERLAALSWGDPSTLVVSSGGVRAMVGEPISLPMAHLLESHGAYSGEFAARQINPALLRGADLVLGMTRRHRRAVLEVFPAATRRTFTLREFARLAEASEDDLAHADGQAPMAALVSAAVQHRGPVTDPTADDIRDPYGLDADVYEEAFEAIRESIDTVARVLRRVT